MASNLVIAVKPISIVNQRNALAIDSGSKLASNIFRLKSDTCESVASSRILLESSMDYVLPRTVAASHIDGWVRDTELDNIIEASVGLWRYAADERSRQEYAEADYKIALDEALLKHHGQSAYHRMTSEINGYASALRSLRELRALPEIVNLRLSAFCTDSDSQHPWLTAVTMRSLSYSKAFLQCAAAMEKHGYTWKQVTLVICYVVLQDLARAYSWSGPYDFHITQAAHQLRRHVQKSKKCSITVMMIRDAEDNFRRKALRVNREECLRYHRYFRVVSTPGGSYIVLSYSQLDFEAGRIPMVAPPPIYEPPEVPVDELARWRGGINHRLLAHTMVTSSSSSFLRSSASVPQMDSYQDTRHPATSSSASVPREVSIGTSPSSVSGLHEEHVSWY